MKRVRKNFDKITLGSLLEDVLFLAFGIFLLVRPVATNGFFVRVFGILVLISAAFSGIRFMYRRLASKIFNISIWNAILKAILGIVIIINPILITNLFMISVGIVLLVAGLIKLYYAFAFYNNSEEIWPLIGVLSVGLIVMGGSLLINPFSEMVLITRVIGVFIICYALFDGMQWMLFRKRCSSILKLFK